MHIIAEVTYKCPAKCEHCPIPLEKRKQTMKLHQFKSALEAFMSYFNQTSRRLLTISGGEPSLLRDLHKFVKIARDLKFTVTIVTNCYNIDNILNAKPDFVQISLDGFMNMHNNSRKIELWSNVRQMLLKIKEGRVKGFVRYTLTKHNFEDLLKIRLFLDSLGLNNVKIYAMPIRKRPELAPTEVDIYNVIKTGVAILPIRCPAGKGQFVITPEMEVLDCIFNRRVLGKLSEFSLEEIHNIVKEGRKSEFYPCGEPYWWVEEVDYYATLSRMR